MLDSMSTVNVARHEYDRLMKDSINYRMLEKLYKELPLYQFNDYIKVLFKEESKKESEVKTDAE